MRIALAAAVIALSTAGSCTGGAETGAGQESPASRSVRSAVPSGATASSIRPTPTPPRPTGSATPAPAPRFDSAAAVATVRQLAGTIGPREATSARYRAAADWLAVRLRAAGYDVRRQPVRVPAGVSWGVPVPAGQTWNVVATTPGVVAGAPYLLVGAHLDTVPQAPGAEDNASGIAVLLEVARAFAPSGGARPRLPLVLVAFGAEEPRGAGDARHHYGSRAYVASLPAAARTALRGMVSLDRVGVGSVVPVCTARSADRRLQAELVAAAARAGAGTRRCANRSSDHWSFARTGLSGVRLGSTPYAEYHSARDLPPVVSRAQLDRTGRLLLAWIRA
ncbi:M20/M25/M40 family metallo-hydrolase [Kribbella sp. NBC_01245]|uniref:M28 family metallopeptidase n=1 Tax=Kribbella sp. NBC_01245 TaxID=2903578 RepID=UPI002E29F77D|nr:M20/M25/M40 family metallo-hydrolase [Kribbella sp. NBC_01245]